MTDEPVGGVEYRDHTGRECMVEVSRWDHGWRFIFTGWQMSVREGSILLTHQEVPALMKALRLAFLAPEEAPSPPEPDPEATAQAQVELLCPGAKVTYRPGLARKCRVVWPCELEGDINLCGWCDTEEAAWQNALKRVRRVRS